MASSAASRTTITKYELPALLIEMAQLEKTISEQHKLIEEQGQRVDKTEAILALYLHYKNYAWGPAAWEDFAKFNLQPPKDASEAILLSNYYAETARKQRSLSLQLTAQLKEYKNQLEMKQRQKFEAIASENAEQKKLSDTVQQLSQNFQSLFQPKSAPPPYPTDEKHSASSTKSVLILLNEEIAQLKANLASILASPVVTDMNQRIDKIVTLATQLKPEETHIISESLKFSKTG